MTIVDLETEIVSEILISATNGHNLDKNRGTVMRRNHDIVAR